MNLGMLMMLASSIVLVLDASTGIRMRPCARARPQGRRRSSNNPNPFRTRFDAVAAAAAVAVENRRRRRHFPRRSRGTKGVFCSYCCMPGVNRGYYHFLHIVSCVFVRA
uniref:Putative secreted protein n=1 Tax=Anopheles marajoara TaxID=58244 RepID=A0A2M4C7X9_9DIPT